MICDGGEQDYFAHILRIEKKQTRVQIDSVDKNQNEPPCAITLYQGMPKGQKMDLIVQKAVELGATRVVPVFTHRSVPRGADREKKNLRWKKIAWEAAKQSGRGVVPAIEEPLDWSGLTKRMSQHDLFLVAYEEQRDRSLKNLLAKHPVPRSAGLFIGPEGGFEKEEIRQLQEHGSQTVGLGPRILRTETAGLVLLSILLYEWELDLGGNQ